MYTQLLSFLLYLMHFVLTFVFQRMCTTFFFLHYQENIVVALLDTPYLFYLLRMILMYDLQ